MNSYEEDNEVIAVLEFDAPGAIYSIEAPEHDVLNCAAPGPADESVAYLARTINKQLDAIPADAFRHYVQESGAWDGEELQDDAKNRERALWMLCCSYRDELQERSCAYLCIVLTFDGNSRKHYT